MLQRFYGFVLGLSLMLLPLGVFAFEDLHASLLLKKAQKVLQGIDAKYPVEIKVVTLIDYSLPSTQKRLWVLDLVSQEILFHEYVAHGKNSGTLFATSFSNQKDSFQSSLGLFLTQDIYHGKHGISLRLKGLQEGINHNALDRYIVVHGASYVSEEFILKNGRLGLSWGCPALPEGIAQEVIETIAGGSYLFIYHPKLDKPKKPSPKKSPSIVPFDSKPPNFPKT